VCITLCLQVGDAAHAAYVDGTGLALSLEDAAVLAWHVQQQGLTAEALRAYEAERIPRVKAVFGLTSKQAAAMKAGVSQRQLLDERAELLYGQAHFKPLQPMAATTAAATQ
jgi:2-polyprenyl-6-methoxyphenol hydroxylase-like FAD-dependent oxidoreductase